VQPFATSTISASLAGLLLLMITARARATAEQWQVSSGGNGHWYEPVACPDGIRWSDAELEAELRGGYLATIGSAPENAFVFGLANSTEYWFAWGTERELGPWLGGQMDASGNWTWVTGEPWSYTNWAPGEPNFSDENRLQYWYYTSPGPQPTWNNATDEGSLAGLLPVHGYVIEFNSQPVPECASYLTTGLAMSLYTLARRPRRCRLLQQD
jgi:hypothetical protein